MRKFINQYIFSPLFWLMSLLLVALFLLVVLLFTPFGPKFLSYVADTAMDDLSIKGVSGSVFSGLKIEEVTWNANVGIVLKDIQVKVDRYDIEQKKLFADNLVVAELGIVLDEKDSEPSAEITELPNFGLPINLDANQLQLDSLKIIKKIPDSDDTQTILFQIEGMVLKKASIKDGQLSFEQLEGKPIILEQALNINVTNGILNMNQPHELSTNGEIRFEHPKLGSLSGDVQIGGTLTQYKVESDLKFEQVKMGVGVLKISGEGDYNKVELNRIDIESPHGTASSTGEISWKPEIRLAFDVEGKDLNTEQFFPEWPVMADAKVEYNGSYIDSRLENKVDIISFDGEFQGQKLVATGQIIDKQGLIRAENIDVQLGDNTLTANGSVTEPLNLALTLDAKNLTQILPELSGEIKGSAAIKGEYKKPQVESLLSINNVIFGEFEQGKQTLTIETDVDVEDGTLTIKKALATLGENNLELSGKASEPYDLKWDIDAKNLKQVSPLISGSLEGEGVLTGTPTELTSTLQVSAKNLIFKETKQGDKELLLEGELSLKDKVIQLSSLSAKSGNNSINVSGQASDPVDLKIEVNAQKLSEVSPDISGKILGSTTIKGPYSEPLIVTDLVGSELSLKTIRLAGSELKLQSEVEIRDGTPIIKQLDTKIGDNTFQLSGKASSPFDLEWNVESKNLKEILPDLSGSLLMKGKLQGTIDEPIINAEGDAKNLSFKDFGLQSADFSASTDNGVYRIKGDLVELKNAEQEVRSAKLELNGTIENHTITALVDHSEAQLNIDASGSWQNPQWNGMVKTLKLGDTKAGDWQLQNPTKVSLGQGAFSAEKFCLTSEKTQACSSASYSESLGLIAEGTIQKTPLSLLSPFLPEGLELLGDIEGSYDIKQNNGKPTGFIKFILPKSSFSFKKEGEDEQSFSYENAEINVQINDREIDTNAKIEILNRGVFSSEAKINLSPNDGQHTINGTANFDIPNINFAQQFIPRSRGLRGALNSELSFSGLLAKPQIRGQANIKDGYLRLPEAGTELTDINLTLRADQPGQAVINGKMFMGEGALNVSGDMDLRDIAQWKADIKVSGENVRFMNTNEVKATMSPDITLNLTPEIVSITGEIFIPEADIQLKAIPETSVDESTDTFIIGETVEGDNVTFVKVRPKLLITLGDNVKMDAFGLEADLSGEVNITHNRQDILANGALGVQNGKFQAYGQDLAIDNGRLIFNGSPRLVGVDIRATRTIDEQIVGIHLGGTLLSLNSTLFSDPSLEESEILSYLITGNTLSSASGQESALLLSAARGLGVTGSGSIVQKIGSSFGLDDVNIVANDDLATSELALGKRLGSRLYVRYLIGLFDQTQKIAIEYKINDALSLEAQTTTEDFGLDFIYEIERD